ncbi:Tim44/TimA family putative adaptor protein [Zavarzinia compransoris]|uniref:Tim44/TimA family putative adaptor protein n=1 Tax=Zavarzinia marina TaxID=2911065 RepID=UPI001F3788AA|nr:Tim44/TimA family putative adaptor protein [Zavarzinia marina]MCF4166835.1 Tim44/TimA family putative adaptor protein [Zavarzinia marina]
MAGFEYLDILFLAVVAGFIGFRLWSVLGQRTGEEQQRDPFTRPRSEPPRSGPTPPAPEDRVVPLPGRQPQTDAEIAARTGPNLTEIRIADRNFEPDSFLAGARYAYEMIVGAFARGDEETLAPLVAPDVMAGFSKVIADRRATGKTAEHQLAALKSATIEKAVMKGRIAEITVRFMAEGTSVVRDAEGRVVEGHPTAVRDMIDVWTFARDTRSRDPNWQLIATAAGAEA